MLHNLDCCMASFKFQEILYSFEKNDTMNVFYTRIKSECPKITKKIPKTLHSQKSISLMLYQFEPG